MTGRKTEGDRYGICVDHASCKRCIEAPDEDHKVGT